MTKPVPPATSGPIRATTGARAAGSPTGVRTLSRIKNRPKAGPLYKVSMIVFTLGALAICVDAALLASGVREIPLWLHLSTALAPLGLILGLIGTVMQARRERDR